MSDPAPDWILQETLAIQATAGQQFLQTHSDHRPISSRLSATTTSTRPTDDHVEIVILDNNRSGLDLLRGFLHAPNTTSSINSVPTHFHFCTTNPNLLREAKSTIQSFNVTIHASPNNTATRAASIFVLGDETTTLQSHLQDPDLVSALKIPNRIIVCTNADPLAASTLHTILSSSWTTTRSSTDHRLLPIIRIVPTAAAEIGESLTIFGEPEQALPAVMDKLLTDLFTRVGRMMRVPAASVGACVAVGAAGTALTTVWIESLAAGLPKSSGGLEAQEVYEIAAHAIRGAAGLVLRRGESSHPAVERDRIVGSNRVAAAAVLAMEEEGVMRSAAVKAVRASIAVDTGSTPKGMEK